MRIICDLDSIVINLLGPWLAEYNRQWGDKLSVDDLKAYAIENFVKPECGMKVFSVFDGPEFYRNLPPLEGAVEALTELHRSGHTIIIASAVASETAQEKFTWCKKHLPFVPHRNIFVGGAKEVLKGDVFIDDAPKNLVAYRNAWPDANIMTIAYPYNRDCQSIVDLYAHSHQDTRGAWREIVGAILSG